MCRGNWLAEETGSSRGTVVARDCARRATESTWEKWTSFVILPDVSGWSAGFISMALSGVWDGISSAMIAGVGSKERESELRAIKMTFERVEWYDREDEKERGAENAGMVQVWQSYDALLTKAGLADRCRGKSQECSDCPDKMVVESSVIKTQGEGVVGEVAVEKRGLEMRRRSTIV